MKTVINTVAGLVMVVGLMAMAGSANDCGSTCGPGTVPNTISEMLMVAGVGLTMFVFGAIILLKNSEEA